MKLTKIREYIEKMKYFQIGLGLTLVLIFIYYRFIKERVTGPLDSTYTSYKFSIILVSVTFLYCILLLTILKPFYVDAKLKEYQQYSGENAKKMKEYLLIQIYHKWITKPLYSFATFLLEPLTSYFENFFFVYFLETAIKLDKYISPLITLLCFFPPALISVIFLIETVFYKQYTYFAFSIYLMIFPLLFRTCLFLLRFLCGRIEESVFSRIIKPLITGHEDKTYIWHEEAYIYVPKEYQTDEELYEQVKKCHKYRSYLRVFDFWKLLLGFSKYKYMFQIFTYFCFFLAACIKLALLH